MSHLPPETHAPVPSTPPVGRPGWTRKRVLLPAAAVVFLAGIGIGGSGGGADEAKTTSDAKPAPTVTVTKASEGGTKSGSGDAEKAGTERAGAPEEATARKNVDEVVFKVWGSAPSGANITYGSDGENIEGHGLPLTKTLPFKGDALYYVVTAQLAGGGDIHCSVTVAGKTKQGHAQGGYNICSAQLGGGPLGGWS
ncbi:hypothetical protein ACQYWQ_29630 [Streptomyces sp. P6-2-1]|uniref:hypothetical protein n=1 Tax=Streptomyces sp. P6-2-1 TaxID=3422591 RepID=UPI003D360CF6